MPFFITKYARQTWSVYLVEAVDPENISSAEGEYLGYFDNQGDGCETAGPFASREEALASLDAWVEGR